MDAIDVIIDKINTQGSIERAELKDLRLEEIDTNFIVEKRKLDKAHEEQLVKQSEQSKKEHQQRKNRLTVNARQNSLKQKQNYLERSFEEVHNRMVEWSIEETQAFVCGILEKIAVDKAVIIPASKMNPVIFSEAWIKETSKALAMTLSVGSIHEQADYGFIIEDNGLQYNFLYRDLLVEERKKSGRKIMEALFS